MKKSLKKMIGSGYTSFSSIVNNIPFIEYIRTPNIMDCSYKLPNSSTMLNDLQSFDTFIGKGGAKLKKRTKKNKKRIRKKKSSRKK